MGAGRPPLPPLQFLSSSGDSAANSPDTPCIPEEMKNASLSLGLQRAACDIHSRLGLGSREWCLMRGNALAGSFLLWLLSVPSSSSLCSEPHPCSAASPSSLLQLDTEEDSYQTHVQRPPHASGGIGGSLTPRSVS